MPHEFPSTAVEASWKCSLTSFAELTATLASRVARGDVTPTYACSAAPPAREGDSRGCGAYLGTVPDYTAMEQDTGGVLLADTRAGGPADRAGRARGTISWPWPAPGSRTCTT